MSYRSFIVFKLRLRSLVHDQTYDYQFELG